MEILCPKGSHKDEIYPVSLFIEEPTGNAGRQAEEEDDRMRSLLAMPAAPKAPVPHRLGCFAWFQVITWAILSGYLAQRLVESRSWLMLGIALLLLALVLFAVVGMLFRLRRADRAAAGEYLLAKQSWEAARAKWERLYYCSRHAIVFDPAAPGDWIEPHLLAGRLASGSTTAEQGKGATGMESH